MQYTVRNRTGGNLLKDGDEIDALRTVCNHAAPDVLTVERSNHADLDGAAFLNTFGAGRVIRKLRNEWPGDLEARKMLARA